MKSKFILFYVYVHVVYLYKIQYTHSHRLVHIEPLCCAATPRKNELDDSSENVLAKLCRYHIAISNQRYFIK